MRYYSTVLCVVIGLSVMGCSPSAYFVGQENHTMREQLNELLKEQVMDNLIRAKRGEVFVHINYSDIQSKGNWELYGEVSAGENDVVKDTVVDNSVIFFENDSTDFSGKVSNLIKTEMMLKGAPLLANKKYEHIYDAYYSFAHHKDGRFQCVQMGDKAFMDKAEKEGIVTYAKRGKDMYYYISPCHHGDFYDLIKRTTLVQNPPQSPGIARSVKIVGGATSMPKGTGTLYMYIGKKPPNTAEKIKVEISNCAAKEATNPKLFTLETKKGRWTFKYNGTDCGGLAKFELSNLVKGQNVTVKISNDRGGSVTKTLAIEPEPGSK